MTRQRSEDKTGLARRWTTEAFDNTISTFVWFCYLVLRKRCNNNSTNKKAAVEAGLQHMPENGVGFLGTAQSRTLESFKLETQPCWPRYPLLSNVTPVTDQPNRTKASNALPQNARCNAAYALVRVIVQDDWENYASNSSWIDWRVVFECDGQICAKEYSAAAQFTPPLLS
jgi:hypothetical protein